MGDCLSKSSENLGKTHITYPMNDLSSVFRDENSKKVKNEKYKVKEISNDGGRKNNA